MLPDGLAEVIGGVSYLRVKTGYPHTHVNVGDTAINWYITAGGEEVVFYEGAVKDITAEYMLDVNHGYVLADPKYLSPVETIVPQPGDVWMLDVSQPHAVIFSPEETDYLKRYRGAADGGRLMLHVTFNIPFSKARDIMQGAGKIL
jgi:hypothetical protein